MRKTNLQRLIDLYSQERFDEVERVAQNIIDKHPKDGVAWKALAAAYRRQGKPELEAARTACKLLPNDYEAFFNLGCIYQGNNEIDDACECYQKSLMLDARHAKVWNNYGNALRSKAQFTDALQCYYKAIQLDPSMAEAFLNLGNDLLGMGKYSKACDYFQKTLELEPDFVEAHSNMIFALDLMSTEDTESQQNARKLWAEAYTDNIPVCTDHNNYPEPDRVIRIGYVSGDFREHSAARVFGGMIMDFDKERFEVYCYDNKSQKDDSYTEMFRDAATSYKSVFKMPDEDMFNLIQDDSIDILVDLAGHSAQNRLAVFAMKPAPIQVTAWGYATGTGIKSIDVFLADSLVVPDEERKFYTEDVRYLPCVASSYFKEEFPIIDGLPYLRNGYITFGCFNRLHKVTDEAFATWSEIMNKVPNSRMIMKAGELTDEAARQNVQWQFVKAGISSDRITLIGNTNWFEHVRAYNLIDIALDPFPHGGGVTAMEGMVMGVPAVCLQWPTIVGRLSSSIFKTVGLSDWVANSANEYVRLAVDKSVDIQGLTKLRHSLRDKFNNSYIGDHESYCRKVENIYIDLWDEWCNSKYSLSPEAL